MAQITEFLINLLLLRRNFLTITAADTIHEAVKKCMNYKRKISIEYANALQMVGPFDNMLEFINYAASQYTSEGENYVVTSQIEYKLCEELGKLASLEAVTYKEENKNENRTGKDVLNQVNMVLANAAINEKVKIKEKGKNFSTTSNLMRHDDDHNDKRKIRNQNYIIDNLHAILKSQELLFKNIVKLINILEKDVKLNINAKKLEQIRNKLSTCTDVLSQNSTSQKFSDLINNIIEEEITRCRFRHGESKTSREISLKIPKPEGIAAALEPAKKKSTAATKSKEDEHNKENKEEGKPSSVKLDGRKETLNRNELETEIKKKSAKFIKEQIPNVIKIDRQNEVLRRDEVEEEIKKSSIKILKQTQQSKIIKINKENEVLCRNKIDSEARRHSSFIKRAKSEPTMSLAIKPNTTNENKGRKYSTSDVESKKIIEMNEEYFQQFENALWHSLTTTKFMSIKDDYQNKNKCAFYNKKHFLAFESALSKQSKEREEYDKIKRFLSVSESMFQILERRLFFEELKEKVESMNKPEATVVKPALVNKKNHTNKISSQDKNDKIKNKQINVKQKPLEGKEKSNFDKVLFTLKENIAASPPKKKITIKRPETIPRPVQNNSNKVNAAINEKNLQKSQKNSDLHKKEKNLDQATKNSQISEANPSEKNILTTTEHGKIVIDNHKNLRNKVEEKKSVKTVNESTKSKQSALEKTKEKTNTEVQVSSAVDKKVKNQEFKGLEVKLNLYKIIKNTASLKNRHDCLALQVVANPDGKLLNFQGKLPIEKKAPKKSLSEVQLKDEAALIEMNKKAFDEMENTLHTVRNFINKHPVIIKSTTSIKKGGNKHTPDEPTKKNLSTKAFITVPSQSLRNCNKMKRRTHILSKGDSDEVHTPISAGKTFVKETVNIQSGSSEDSKSDEEIKYLYTEKSRTFLKSATQEFVETRRLKHTLAIPITKISNDHKLLQMRRTTKTAMKKQQVLTILPKLSTTNYKRKQSKEWLTEKNESKMKLL